MAPPDPNLTKSDEILRDVVPLEKLRSDEYFCKILSRCEALLNVKGRDYNNGKDCTIEVIGPRGWASSFYKLAERTQISPRQALWVLFSKGIFAIERAVIDGYVESESFDERIADAINYLMLLGKLVRDERRAEDEAARERVGFATEAVNVPVDDSRQADRPWADARFTQGRIERGTK